MENLPLRDFQSNPTKITNALRQIRSTLKVDGLCCYFDSFLSAEALGCMREWRPDGSWTVTSAPSAGIEELIEKRGSLDQISGKGSMKVACEVLQRLRVMLKDEPALMVGVAGPHTLARQVAGGKESAEKEAASSDLLDFAAEVTGEVAKSFLEAGADILMFLEQDLPDFATAFYEHWTSLLAPILNVVQFYEALPVLLLSESAIANERLPSLLGDAWSGAWCPLLTTAQLQHWNLWSARGGYPGLAVNFDEPRDAQGPLGSTERIGDLAAGRILLTSAGDVSSSVDLKHLAATLGRLREDMAKSWP